MKAKLLKPHTHAGKEYNIGDSIEVDQSTYEWLANLKVATIDGEAVKPTHERSVSRRDVAVLKDEPVADSPVNSEV